MLMVELRCWRQVGWIFLSMKRNSFMMIALFARIMVGTAGYSQAPAPARLDPDLVAFFTGHWKGEGAFAQGQKIAAEVSFAPSLDSAWLVYEHRDVPPGAYKATSMWGVDERTGQFVAVTFDNFHGHRQWLSSGWSGGKLVLSTGNYSSPGGMMFEHFIYERLSATQFKMTYEVSRDGITWRLGDWLVFTRE
jgi:hypothetical protein